MTKEMWDNKLKEEFVEMVVENAIENASGSESE